MSLPAPYDQQQWRYKGGAVTCLAAPQWNEDELLERGLPLRLVNHLATMADLHRTGRSDDVLTLAGQKPLSVQEFVGRNAATFAAPIKGA